MATRFNTKMNLANFTCKFGEKFVMLDFFEEVVLPAFIGKNVRKFGDAQYSILNPTLLKFGDGELAISGRFVKDTIIERSQVLVNGELVEDRQEMESAPTSFFMLFLSNHKLLYVRENSGAAPLSSFASTISLFLGDAYKKWVRGIYDERKKSHNKIKWADLHREFPPPVLTVTPLLSESSVTAFLEKFRTVNTVEIRLLGTNHELDNSPIFEDMREIQEKIGADNIVLRSQKSGVVGLDRGNVAKLIGGQAGDGNSVTTVKGKAINGESLSANNDSFTIAIPIAKLPSAILAAAEKAYAKLKEQLSLGTIVIHDVDEEAKNKVKNIIQRKTWG